MPRYEFTEGGSSKFWEISRDRNRVVVSFGKMGAKGQTQVKDHPGEADARTDMEKQIAAKLKKGYLEVGKGTSAAAQPATTATAKAGKASKTRTAAAPASEWQRLEYELGPSSKFWETKLDGKRLYLRFGKIGTAGQTRFKDFRSTEEAQAQREKEIAQKRKEGYADAGGGAAAPAPAPTGMRAASNPELERAILQDLDDDEARLVYGDWLQGQGDPRGELITVQAGLKKNPKDRKLRAAEEKLLEEHAAHFYGKLADVMDLLDGVEWQLGFIRKARVQGVYDRDEEFGDGKLPHVDVEDVVAWLLDHPSGRFLQELTVGIVTFMDNSYTDVCNVLGKRKLPALRKLFLGDFTYEETELNWSTIGNAKNLYRGVPNLRSLTLRSGSMTLGNIDLPELRELVTISGGMGKSPTKSICAATWPRLERLSLQFGPESDVTVKDLRPILEGTSFPALKHLGLTNFEHTDELCAELGRSEILARIEELDLKMGTMSDAGAANIHEQADRFRHLELLDVHDNFLTDAGKKLLKKVVKRLELGEQRESEDGENRYASAYE